MPAMQRYVKSAELQFEHSTMRENGTGLGLVNRLQRGGEGRAEGRRTQDLLRDDREHLELDAVELVEAGPRARRRQALEELAHRDVVETYPYE